MLVTIFEKYSILIVWQSSQYAYEKYSPEACLEPNKTCTMEFCTVILEKDIHQRYLIESKSLF